MSIPAKRQKLQMCISVVGVLLIAGVFPAFAATLCVNTGGTSGCYSSISAAVAAAGSGDTIIVAQGTYTEDVTITKSVSLIGANRENTIIDATGQLNGITIKGTSDLAVSGFTIENAETAGLWITNSSRVTISENIVRHNDLGLVPPTCPPLAGTPFENGENLDCGEGVFLSAVDHSILSKNTITDNAGGMLVTDDTGPTHDNLAITRSLRTPNSTAGLRCHRTAARACFTTPSQETTPLTTEALALGFLRRVRVAKPMGTLSLIIAFGATACQA
jgi:hypothetical protein